MNEQTEWQKRPWLKDLREKAGLTQLALSRVCGVSLRAVQQWEAGERDPSRENVFALARILGAEVLMRFDEEWATRRLAPTGTEASAPAPTPRPRSRGAQGAA